MCKVVEHIYYHKVYAALQHMELGNKILYLSLGRLTAEIVIPNITTHKKSGGISVLDVLSLKIEVKKFMNKGGN